MLNLNFNPVNSNVISDSVDSQNLGREVFRRISYVISGGHQRRNDCAESQILWDSSSFTGVDTYLEKCVCVECTVLSMVVSWALTPVMKNAHAAGTREYLHSLVLMYTNYGDLLYVFK